MSFGSEYVAVRAEIQEPTVYISTAKVEVETAYLGVPLTRQVRMVNLSNLEVSSLWWWWGWWFSMWDVVDVVVAVAVLRDGISRTRGERKGMGRKKVGVRCCVRNLAVTITFSPSRRW